MTKFKNDREVKIGDVAIKRDPTGNIAGGIVLGIYGDYISFATFNHWPVTAGQMQLSGTNDYIIADADGKAIVARPTVASGQNASEFLHADDALKAFEKLESTLT